LDHSTFHKKPDHLQNFNLTRIDIDKFSKEHIALMNTQPPNTFRSHYEFISNQRKLQLPSGKYNTWYAIMMLYIAIWNLSINTEKKNAEKAKQRFSLDNVNQIYGDLPCDEGL
jgi:hypothetical protein